MWSLVLLGIAGLVGASGAFAGKIVSNYADKSKNEGVTGIFSDVTALSDPATAGQGAVSPFDAAVGLSSAPVAAGDLTAGAPPFTVTVPVADGTIRYRAQRGDTIAALAARFGITPETIRWANPSVGRTIRPGADITILPVSGVRYAVVPGDSLETIGARYGIAPEMIRRFNPRYQEILAEGSGSLVLPGAVEGKKTKEKR